jgi:membrane-bound metal-dependent hydrolase YbcI (DUF457 family)
MKGIAHFITGVAIATLFPEVVDRAAQGSLLPVLGGIAGILPDTLDFKFVRYFERYDTEIDPGPEPDARDIAERVVGAMRRAYETGQSQSVMLHTVRLGADLWRQYAIRFDPEQNEVAVRIGPIVSTGQIPLPGSEPSGPAEARLEVGVPLAPTYDAEIQIDVFSGPSFRFERQGDQLHRMPAIRVHFLDWHRRWSHSLTLAAALGLGAAGVAALVELVARGTLTRTPLWSGLVVGLGFVAHVLEDQLGYLGSNLLCPLTRRRTRGAQLLRSGDAVPNFLTVWASVALILFNLDRFAAEPRLAPWWFLGLAVMLPIVALGGMYQWQRRRERPEPKESLRQSDIVSEMEEVEVG